LKLKIFLGFLGMEGKLVQVLTPRRRQFLDAIKEIYDRTQAPVHYTELAEALEVSKWTAYDMVRSLASIGAVRLDYVHDSPGKAGRSKLGAIPVNQEANVSTTPSEKEVQRTKERLLGLLQRVHKQHVCLQSLIRDAKTSNSGELSFVYLVAIICVLIKILSPSSVQYWLQATSPEVGLTGALGFVMGLASVSKLPQEVLEYLRTAVNQVETLSKEISAKEKAFIMDFWQETLAAI